MFNVYYRGTSNIAGWHVKAASAKAAKQIVMLELGLTSDSYLIAKKV